MLASELERTYALYIERSVVGAGVPLLGAAILSRLPGVEPSDPPNIVFLLADDLGYADVSCYGRPDIKTANIDRICSEGVRFLQGYANSAVCSATRTALITGRYQYRLRVGLEEPLNTFYTGLPPAVPTIPSLLRARGYETMLIGKWHLGLLPEYGPLKSGYDHFYGFRGGALDYYAHTDVRHEDDLWDGETPIHQTGYMTDLIGDRAVRSIDAFAKKGKPFFLDVHFNAPHWPWEAVGDENESERLRKAALADFDGGTIETYRNMILRMDMQIGRILKALDQHSLAKNTIVVFTSDNGGERFADVWPFTGMKEDLLEGGLRIPMLMRWPARLRPGLVSDQVAMSMDWLPTLLAASGGAPDPAYPSDGINLLPLLVPKAVSVRRKLFWRYKANAQRAARDGDWKILKINENTFLFNVVEDPLERANLRDRRRDIYDRMVVEWNIWDADMLPEVKESFTNAFTAKELADHIGAQPSNAAPDLGHAWPKLNSDD